MPAVSVLMPVRDARQTLPACIESLRRQTLDDFELVLVDDGSEDDSAQLARELWADDGRLRLLAPGRVGLVAALDLGLGACRADLVARVYRTLRVAAEHREDGWVELAVRGPVALVERMEREIEQEGAAP